MKLTKINPTRARKYKEKAIQKDSTLIFDNASVFVNNKDMAGEVFINISVRAPKDTSPLKAWNTLYALYAKKVKKMGGTPISYKSVKITMDSPSVVRFIGKKREI